MMGTADVTKHVITTENTWPKHMFLYTGSMDLKSINLSRIGAIGLYKSPFRPNRRVGEKFAVTSIPTKGTTHTQMTQGA
jgi:hypothetical protein